MSDENRLATIGIEQITRPKIQTPVLRVQHFKIEDAIETVEHEVVYHAHIFPARARQGEHHGEGKTPAQALVNAALHWERYGG